MRSYMYLDKYFLQSSDLIKTLADETHKVKKISEMIAGLAKNKSKILIAGNGGSCADAEHFSGELVCTFKDRDRLGIPAISLASNPAAITAWANDFEYNTFFKRQVEALGNRGDILFLISTGGGDRASGASMNLVYAAEAASLIGIKVVSLVGKGGGILDETSDISINVKSDVTSLIQEAHISLIHCICLQVDFLLKEGIA